MGTNYYLTENVCQHCGRGDPRIHIGKSSAGWCFSLHVHPDDGINDLRAWEIRWSQHSAQIKDEYGGIVEPSEMKKIITERAWHGHGWSMASLAENHAVTGPHGLVRHALMEGHCIGHGDGVYDLIVGDFS